MYLRDECNGFLLTDNTAQAVVNVLSKVLSLNDEQYSNMRLCARETAENAFDYRKYIKTVESLLTGDE